MQPERSSLFLLILVGFSLNTFAQDTSDSTKALNTVIINIYPSAQNIQTVPAAVSIINLQTLQRSPTPTLLPSLNSVAGVRMEERSPGSYRLSIRGSVLRSPFGIRNIKVYLDDFPLTDAGGNTYLNLIEPSGLSKIELTKGPDGSLFGANTGGVLRLETNPADSSSNIMAASGGSFGLFTENVSYGRRMKNSSFALTEAFKRSDGYRENSALNKKYLQGKYKFNYGSGSSLNFTGFYADLDYLTPGGLTPSQADQNPRAARYPTSTIPGAKQQQAGIINKTFFGGISSRNKSGKNWYFTNSLFASHTDFKNPFITNYEVRDETNFGLRSLAGYQKSLDNTLLSLNIGTELQQNNALIDNYDNNKGEKGAVQTKDEIRTRSGFIFTQISAATGDFKFETALSYNGYDFHLKDLESPKSYPQFMPRFAAAYLLRDITIRASISRGFSPPTLAEIRPSGAKVNQTLRPESGWNYETGLRYITRNGKFSADISVFHFNLDNTIVRRVNPDDTEYFINAGSTSQPGFEMQLSGHLIENSSGFFRHLSLSGGLTAYNFRFKTHASGSVDYSGNALTGVPRYVFSESLNAGFLSRFLLSVQHLYTSSIYLNDENSVSSKSYHLLQGKAAVNTSLFNKNKLSIFVTGDNLLNQKYSLGNDLNAFGNRYYNPAPSTNFTGGLTITF